MAATATTLNSSPDGQALEAWLTGLPADPRAAFAALRQRIQALSSGSIAAQERFMQLERLRRRAAELMPGQRSCYLGKAIPLDDAESQAWEDCVGLWEALYIAYALCTESSADPAHAAMAWQRALDCLGRAMREHGYGYRSIPAALWKEFNNCYRAAEGCGLTEQPVEDLEQPATKPTCKSVYLATVLYDAAQVAALSPAQLQALEQLLPNWVSSTNLCAEMVAESSRSPLAIDLSAENGARLARTLQPSPTVRYVDTTELAPRLRDLATAVRAGTLPLELAPARALAQAASERLLTQLYIQWCSAGTGRLDERRTSTLRAQVALNMHAVHFQISGRAFRQPGLRYTRDEEHDLHTFGHITERTEQRLLTARSSAAEPWEVINQSSSGMLSMLRKPDLASRLCHGQLVAMRTSSMEPPFLAVVQRLLVEPGGAMSIGVRVVRGNTRGVAARPVGDPTLKYERALSVDADQERGIPAYLIVPAGMFAQGAMLELHSGRAEKVVINAILERGPDYDRVTYTKV